MQKQTTYKDAGVNIDAGNALVEDLKAITQSTARTGATATLGSFGGIFDLAKLQYKDPLLVSTTDGVGTKLKIAQQINQHKTIGIDLVAMCANDLLVHGAEPLFFLDYFATSKLNVEQARDIIAGIGVGCQLAGCALTGGETAEMPGMYHAGEYDLAGFAVGIVERDQLLPQKTIAVGDMLIGLPSSGVHANGFSLIRFLLAKNDINLTSRPAFDSSCRYLYEELLRPTTIYVQQLQPLLKEKNIKALAHITGGGLLENIPRILPKHLGVVIEKKLWPVLPIFEWIKQLGTIEEQEMYRTFNMGIGMVAIVAPNDASKITDAIKDACVIGQVTNKGNDKKQIIII